MDLQPVHSVHLPWKPRSLSNSDTRDIATQDIHALLGRERSVGPSGDAEAEVELLKG